MHTNEHEFGDARRRLEEIFRLAGGVNRMGAHRLRRGEMSMDCALIKWVVSDK